MVAPLANAITAASLLAALWTLVLVLANRPMLLDRPATRALLLGLGTIAAAVCVQAVVSTVLAFTVDLGADRYTLVGYALTIPFIVPLTVLWGLNDRSRWGAGVVLIGLLTVPVMIVRMNDVWATRA